MFYLGGVGLAFFLTILLVSKSKKTIADKILALWLVVITTHLLLFYFRKMWIYPQTLGIAIPFPLAALFFIWVQWRSPTKRDHYEYQSFTFTVHCHFDLYYKLPVTSYRTKNLCL